MIILTLWINLLFFSHLIDELFGLNKSENNENEWWYEYLTSKKKKKAQNYLLIIRISMAIN